MVKYLKTTGIFFGVWFIAAVLNGLACGISLAAFEGDTPKKVVELFITSIVGSFVFSVPCVGLTWFITIVGQMSGMKGQQLFQMSLRTTFFCGISAALLFIFLAGNSLSQSKYIAGLCIVVFAMTAVLFFRKNIKTDE